MKLQEITTTLVKSENRLINSTKNNFKTWCSVVEFVSKLSKNDRVLLKENIAKDSDVKIKTIEKQIGLLINAFEKNVDLSKFKNFYGLTKINSLLENGAKVNEKGEITDVESANKEIKKAQDGEKLITDNEIIEIKKNKIFKEFILEIGKKGYNVANVTRALNSEIAEANK